MVCLFYLKKYKIQIAKETVLLLKLTLLKDRGYSLLNELGNRRWMNDKKHFNQSRFIMRWPSFT